MLTLIVFIITSSKYLIINIYFHFRHNFNFDFHDKHKQNLNFSFRISKRNLKNLHIYIKRNSHFKKTYICSFKFFCCRQQRYHGNSHFHAGFSIALIEYYLCTKFHIFTLFLSQKLSKVVESTPRPGPVGVRQLNKKKFLCST